MRSGLRFGGGWERRQEFQLAKRFKRIAFEESPPFVISYWYTSRASFVGSQQQQQLAIPLETRDRTPHTLANGGRHRGIPRRTRSRP